MFVISVYLIFSMLAVLWFDVTRYIIPNWLVASLFVVYPVALAMEHTRVDWKMAAVGMVLVFIIGYFIFCMKWMGGGDIKLLTACSLWIGWKHLPDFLFVVAAFGGVFSLFILMLRQLGPYLQRGDKLLPRVLQRGAPLPYGVAIVFGFMVMIWTGKVEVIL